MSIRKLASETAIYGLSSILGRGLYFLLTPLYTDYFEPFELGVQATIFTIIPFLMVVATLRLDVAYFRNYGKVDEGTLLGTSFLTIASVTGLLGFILMLIAPWLSEYLGFSAYSGLFVVGGGIMMFDALTELPLAKLRMEGRPLKFAFVRFANILLNLSLNVFWIYLLPKWPSAPSWMATPYAGITYIFMANIAASAFTFLLVAPELRGLNWSIDWALLKRLLNFSAPLIIVGLSFIINEMLDRFLLPIIWPGGKEEGLSLVGVYSQNYKLAMLLALFTQAFRYGAEPFFFRESEASDAKERYAKLTWYYFIAALFGFMIVCLFLPALSQLFLRNPEYRVGSDVVPILLLANLCLGMYYNFAVWYKVTDNTKFGAYISVAGAIITVVLNFILIPYWGFYGCALATLVCYGSMMLATFFLGKSRYEVPYAVRHMLTLTGMAIGLVALFWWLSPKLGTGVMELAVEGGSTAAWIKNIGFGAALLLLGVAATLLSEKQLRRAASAT